MVSDAVQLACEKWIACGFKFYEGQPAATRADHMLQKRIIDGADTLFFINVMIYDFTKYGDRERVGLQPQVQFNLDNDETHPTFDVDLCNGNEGPEFAERFFMDVYQKLNCKPYEKGGSP